MALPNQNGTTFSDLATSVSSPQTDNSTNYNVGLLVNQNNVAEGPTIPPIQQGQFRIPRPNAFVVSSIANARPMGSLIVFSWEDIDSFGSEIGEYRILANFAYDNNATPTEVGSSQNSPCTVQVVAPTATDAVFFLRPYLTNGQTLPLEQCPSCTVSIPAPVFQFASGNDTVYIDDQRPTTSGGGGTTTVTFNLSDNWTCPANVTTVQAECYGGGGAGGSGGTTTPGAGGGGGAYAKLTLGVSPGGVYPVTVGYSAQPSWFGNATTVLAAPGSNGQNGLGGGINATGGAAGKAADSIGSTTTDGSPGGDGVFTGTNGGNGGAGAAPAGGAGGVGTPAEGAPGAAPGGGGAGSGINVPGVGGIGATGRVILTYTVGAGGGAAPGIGVVNSNGRQSSLTDIGLVFFNTAGKVTAAIGTNGTGADPGYLELADGTAGHTLVLLPNSATTATSGAQTLPGNPAGFLLGTLGGTAIKIPYYLS